VGSGQHVNPKGAATQKYGKPICLVLVPTVLRGNAYWAIAHLNTSDPTGCLYSDNRLEPRIFPSHIRAAYPARSQSSENAARRPDPIAAHRSVHLNTAYVLRFIHAPAFNRTICIPTEDRGNEK